MATRLETPLTKVATLRAAIYARISREDEGNVDNTDIQVDECEDYIDRMGWECVGVYIDDNRSAYSGRRRKHYERLIADIQAGKIDVIVCTEMTRLNRRLWLSIDLFKLAETTPLCRIATTDDGGPDLSTKEGIHSAVKLAMEAEKESMTTSTRMKRKHRKLAKDGKANGGFRPFGHQRTGKGELSVYEPEAEIVREIVRRLLDGESGRSVLKDLRRRGVKTTTGKDFHASDLVRSIESPRLCGLRTHLGTLHESKFIEPVISREEWEQLQLVWGARAANKGCSVEALSAEWHPALWSLRYTDGWTTRA